MEFDWENIVRCMVRRVPRYFDEELAQRSLWFAVAARCGVEPSLARELCQRFGVDPDEKFPETPLQRVFRLCREEMEDETQGPAETCSKMWDHVLQAAQGP